MKCPFCNADMKEEQVFCESCGKEIHLVPLFDPSVELTMEQSLSGIADHVAQKEHPQGNDASEPENTSANSHFSVVKIVWIVISAIVAITLIVCAVLITPKFFSADAYYESAYAAYDIGKDARAKEYAIKALEKQLPVDKQYDMAMLIATICAGEGQDDESAAYYQKCIVLKPDETMAYDALIALYERSKSYEQIAQLLSSCENPQITTKYAKYLANKPAFDTPSGEYDCVIYQKILTDGEGEIHYTINGEKPTNASEKYGMPIKLETGVFHIEAVFINRYGVESETASVDLTIDVAAPDGPEISLESGAYHEPQYIDVFMPDHTYSVYYTIDGDQPDLSSVKYESPLLLQLGSHTYRFIMYDEDGVASDVEERTYQLDLPDAVILPEAAKYMLIQNLVVRGILSDATGHLSTTGEIRQYDTNTAFSQEGQTFYLFVESVHDSSGGNIATGTLYGVQVQTGEVYKVFCDDSGLYQTQPL